MKIFHTKGTTYVTRLPGQFILAILFSIAPASVCYSQKVLLPPHPAADTTTHSGSAVRNSGKVLGSRSAGDSTHWGQRRKISVLVTPDSAAGASITIVRKSKIESDSSSVSTLSITPDTVGTWRSPLSMVLFQGDYDFIATRSGFRQAEESVRLDYNSADTLSINMFSLSYLRRMREQWGTYKWISAGVAAGAGLATLFFYDKIRRNMSAYNTAATPSAIASSKSAVKSSQSLYTISSAVALTAVGSFLVTWLIRGLYHK